MLENAILFATKAHKGQKDKGGKPYILHPLRVMLCCKKQEEQITAILHDVLEDTNNTKEDLQKAGFSDEIVEAVVCLTKQKNEDYFDYIHRVKQNKIARIVKLADLEDNMDLKRLLTVTEKDKARVQKYQEAKELLEKC